jgi:putative addiction module killer protein
VPEIRIYQTKDRESPFEDWLDNLNDFKAKARILQRIDRIELGNFGDCEPVGDGVHELRIDYGPGYRIYFGNDGRVLVILLFGGTKRHQEKDIKKAKEYWQDYKAREKPQRLG